MATSLIQGNLTLQGHLAAESMTLPDSSVDNDTIDPSTQIDATKLEQQYSLTHVLSAHATSIAAKRETIYIANVAGTIVSFDIGMTVAPTGGDSVTINLKKNGSNILTGNISLDNTNANFDKEAGVLSSNTYSAGDIFEVDISAVSGTSAKGISSRLIVREPPG